MAQNTSLKDVRGGEHLVQLALDECIKSQAADCAEEAKCSCRTKKPARAVRGYGLRVQPQVYEPDFDSMDSVEFCRVLGI